MSFFISDAIADAGAQTAAQSPDPLASLILPIGLVVLFYFFLIRPQSKRQKEHRQMVSELQGLAIQLATMIVSQIVGSSQEMKTVSTSTNTDSMGSQTRFRNNSAASLETALRCGACG